MKKIIILVCIIISGTLGALAEVNMPSAPIYTNSSRRIPPATRVTPTQTTSTNSVKAELDALALGVLQAGERMDEQEARTNIGQMLVKGATGLSRPVILKTEFPNQQPVEMELNGQQLRGNLCMKFSYEYENQNHWVGYCK